MIISGSHRRRAARVLLGIVIPLLALAAIARVMHSSGLVWWDAEPLRAADLLDDRNRVNRLMTAVMQLSMVAEGLLAIAVAGLLIARGHIRAAAFWTFAIVGVIVLDPLLKDAFHREAIGGGTEWSFPSGNAMLSMALLAAGIVLAPRSAWLKRAVAIAAALVVAQGAWLVAIKWHYPSDVVAGWCVATAWVTALALAVRDPYRSAKRAPTSSALSVRS